MATLDEKLQNALDEGRILILGLQVLIGFQYNAVLQSSFDSLPADLQFLQIIGLILLLLAFGMLLAVPGYHQIAVRGELTARLNTFSNFIMGRALLPIALGLALDLYIVTETLVGRGTAFVLGLAVGVMALFLWYGLEFLRRGQREHAVEQAEAMSKDREKGESSPEKQLANKIKEVMTETRMILPGAQALLGFQTIAFLMGGFEKLPDSAKYLHLGSLLAITLAIILLMAPAAYHRLVEEGENTEHFFRVARRFMIASMLPLAVGISGDLYVVVVKITSSPGVAIAGALLSFLVFIGLWYVYGYYRRRSAL